MGKSPLSRSAKGDVIGAAWLCNEYGVTPVQPLRFTSKIGGDSVRREVNGRHENTFHPTYAPTNSLAGHLEFLLKHERVHLELLSRLFQVTGAEELATWMTEEPTGRYSRRAAWLYEWLTGRRLNVPDVAHATYVDALEPERYWTATSVTSDKRFRVRNNMPGTPDQCPMVLLDANVRQAVAKADVPAAIAGLEKEFGADLLHRASIWLTVKESKASFMIEGESDPTREERFAAAMELHLGQLGDLFGNDLETLQREVLGPRSTHYGLRQSPIFVGQTIAFRNVVHYIAPDARNVPQMMRGLAETMARTAGSTPLIRAASLSFAYVYIHPLCDGNGRVSRFVLNDIFRRDGLIEAPLVLPISATINKDMASYDRILDVFSAPLRRRYAASWRFGADVKYPDGVISNFEFDAYDDALHAWRYPDLTDHVVYGANVVAETLATEIVQEAEYLRKHYEMRRRVGEVIQVGNNDLDRIIRSVSETRSISGKLLGEYPILSDETIRGQVLRAILTVLEE